MIGKLIGVACLFGVAGAACFLVLYGSPRRYLERVFGWHLFWTALAGGLQWAGMLLSAWSLWPLMVTEWLAVTIMYWRIGLLVATRRRAHLDRRRDMP